MNIGAMSTGIQTDMGAIGIGASANAGKSVTEATGHPDLEGGKQQDISLSREKALKHSGIMECSTCDSRKYKDGSDESNVSFKSATHIDPSASASKVMAHEQEHVSNAYSKAAKGNGEVMSATVTLKTAVCPECGKNYVSGGVTHTAVKYTSNNPYSNNQKSADYSAVAGSNVNTGI